ncbi:MAG: ABC transporter permease [Saprospiraceae bacterium]|nr:MAG: ABC transporter permease [Saprospiraceae bacterium]
MIHHYLKTALRGLSRQKGNSFLNIAGLALGLLVSMLMFLWVQDELGYDRFHKNEARIFRLHNLMNEGNGAISNWQGTPAPYANVLREALPEIENVTALGTWSHKLIVDEKSFLEHGAYAFPYIFDVFSFDFLEGDLGNAFSDPNSIVLSEKLAAKFFGINWREEGRTIGQSIALEDGQLLNVTGVFADIPRQSTLNFDYLIPIDNLEKKYPGSLTQWGSFNFDMYFLLSKGADPKKTADKMYQIIKDNTQGGYPEHGMFLQPLKDQYLYSKFENGKPVGGRIDYVQIFFLAALFVLFIACINYMNLTTARSSQRAREVGVRKVVGAPRSKLVSQFITEALLTTFLAGVLALIGAQFLLPYFNTLTGKEILIDFLDPGNLLLFTGFLTVVGVLAGSYPALMMSSFDIIKILKGKLTNKWGAVQLRRLMVIMQFTLSMLLLIGAIVVRGQINYLKSADLGMDKKNVVFFPLSETQREKLDLFKNELSQQPNIEVVTGSDSNPLRINSMTGDPVWEGMTDDQRGIFNIIITDHQFLNILKVPLIAGENFRKEMTVDTTNMAYIINEEAARTMGLESPIGKKLSFWGDEGRIIGVVKDFHFSSLHQPIKPLILRYDPEGGNNLILIRPKDGQTEAALAELQTTFQKISGGETVAYEFLDQLYEKMYKSEETTSDLADLFAVIALIISCLGLLGLSAFLAERRTKEVGIRKVLGASVGNILMLLNKEFGQLLLIAFLTAAPLAWYLLRAWLQKFAYHVDIGWQMILVAGLIMGLTAALTVSFYTLRSALRNPVKALRYE